MSKNIVLCCDVLPDFGLRGRRTNVLKLYNTLLRSDLQVVHYLPGPRKSAGVKGIGDSITGIFKALLKLDFIEMYSSVLSVVLRGEQDAVGQMALGSRILTQISSAYEFLLDNYQPGDHIFLFGFSSAAYVARAVAALLQVLGMIDQQYRSEVSELAKLLAKASRHERIEPTSVLCEVFRNTFARDCTVQFVGVWDTVASPGWLFNPVVLPTLNRNPGVVTARQALSIDERRCFFQYRGYGPPFSKHEREYRFDQDIQDVWFAGVHSDVGGGYAESESGLSQVTLEWMLGEASAAGLMIDNSRARTVLGLEHGPNSQSCTSAIPGCPDPRGPIHRSLNGFWWEMEVLPGAAWDPITERRRYTPHLGKARQIPLNAYIHESVLARMKQDATYRPANFPATYVIAASRPIC